jgi:ferredoxin-thioredoxin reductase catalytic subunit
VKYHNWLKNNYSGKIIEIIIREENGIKIEAFKFNSEDRKTVKKILKIIKVKYGVNIAPERLDEDKKDRDLDWLK